MRHRVQLATEQFPPSALVALGLATGAIGVGTGVTAPVFRHNPAVAAQFAATMEEL